MKLLVKMLTGFSFTVDGLQATDTVHELKGRVYEREGYLPVSQRIADGATKANLDNDVTLEEAGFKDGDTTHLLVAVEALKEEKKKDQEAHDWREKRSHEQRLQHLLETGMCFDVLLQVQKASGEWEDILAHRTILAQASSVFEILCEPTPQSPHPRVKVTDISSEAIWQLLRCIYCGPLKLDATNVVRLYQAAVTYRLTELIDKCREYMGQSLDQWSNGDLLTLLDTLASKEHEVMAHTIVAHISQKMKQYILQPEFAHLARQSLDWILESENMYGCREIDLYGACVGWARKQCLKDGVDPTGPACRQALGHCLNNIHFPAMTLEEFAEVSTGLGILTADERANVYDHLVLKGETTKPLPFPLEARRRRPRALLRFDQSPTTGWTTANRVEALDFQVDNEIELTAISVYGASDGETQFDVQVQVMDANGTVLGGNTERIVSSTDTNIHNVTLVKPVSLKANVQYTLSMMNPGTAVNCVYGRGGRRTYAVEGEPEVTINISNSRICQTKTNYGQGQLPGFVFC